MRGGEVEGVRSREPQGYRVSSLVREDAALDHHLGTRRHETVCELSHSALVAI